MNRSIAIVRLACPLLLLLSGWAVAQPAPFTGPAESFDLKNQLPPLTAAIEQKNFADAAARVDAMLQGDADAVVNTTPELGQSLRAWLESLSAATRESIEPEYDKLVGASAKQALDNAITKPGSSPEDFIAVANAYPLSDTAKDAWARAAMRAIDFGDVQAAAIMLQRAKDRGWKPSESQKALFDSIAKLSLPVGGSMQSAAPWYVASPPPFTKRVIPVAAGGSVFIATERGLVAAKETGELLWQSAVAKSDSGTSGAKAGLHRPAVLCDPTGKPQVVITRQLIAGTRFGCLHAYRASDGKPLWSTESTALGSWSLVSAPTIAGRVVMVIGIDDTTRPAPVAVFAFETMTGRQLWQATLGGFASLSEGRDTGSLREVEALWSSSGVAIDGGDVFVSPSVGVTECLDRFDGRLKWARTYTPSLTPGDELIDLGRRALRREPGTHELIKQKTKQLKERLGNVVLPSTPAMEGKDKNWREVSPELMALGMYFSQPARWLSTPVVAGDTIIVAGADMSGAAGLNRRSGEQLWQSNDDDLKGATLLGVAGDNAVFAGDKLIGLDLRTSKVVWTWTPPNSEAIAGPPSLNGKAVRAVAGRMTYVVSSDTGKPDPLTSAGTGLQPTLTNDASRAALGNIDAYGNFSVISGKTPPEPKKK